MSVPAAARFFLASELDQRPVLLTPVDLEPADINAQSEGYMLLRLFISETGRIENVVVVLNDAPDPLAALAVRRFGDARYSPGFKNQVPVKSQILIEIKLRRGSPSTQ